MTTVEISLTDLEDARHVLSACLTLLTARDIEKAQANMAAQRPSPLTQEVERMKERFDGHLADYLLARHEAKTEGGPAEGEADEDDELVSAPLGEPNLPRQAGRRLTIEEMVQQVADAVEEDA
jgi:hypothetical protein